MKSVILSDVDLGIWYQRACRDQTKLEKMMSKGSLTPPEILLLRMAVCTHTIVSELCERLKERSAKHRRR